MSGPEGRPDLAARLEREVKKRRQPWIRAKTKEKTATTSGIAIDTQARTGITASIGSTDEDRLRHLTVAPPWPKRPPGPRQVSDRLCPQGILYGLCNDSARKRRSTAWKSGPPKPSRQRRAPVGHLPPALE